MIDKKRKMALAASLSAMASVQGGASIAKTLFAALGPAGVATLRTGLAGLLLTVIHRPQIRKFTREQWLCVLFYGFSTGAMNLIFYYGVQRIPLGLAVTVEYLGPLGLALIRSRKATDFLWAILAGLGVALIVPWSKQHTANGVDPLGLLLVLVAGVMCLRSAAVSKDEEFRRDDLRSVRRLAFYPSFWNPQRRSLSSHAETRRAWILRRRSLKRASLLARSLCAQRDSIESIQRFAESAARLCRPVRPNLSARTPLPHAMARDHVRHYGKHGRGAQPRLTAI